MYPDSLCVSLFFSCLSCSYLFVFEEGGDERGEQEEGVPEEIGALRARGRG